MRTCTLLLPIILWASTAAGGVLFPDRFPPGHWEWGPFGDGYYVPDEPGPVLTASAGPASTRYVPELLRATPTLPATLAVMTPVDISFTPPMPTPQDEVVMTITGWKQVATHVVDRVEVRTEGREIFVDVYWIDAPPPSSSPISQIQHTVEQVPRAQMTSTFQRYEITRSLGTFEPGMYTVHVTNRGVMGGETSAIFTVRDLSPSLELGNSFWPYWLFPLR